MSLRRKKKKKKDVALWKMHCRDSRVIMICGSWTPGWSFKNTSFSLWRLRPVVTVWNSETPIRSDKVETGEAQLPHFKGKLNFINFFLWALHSCMGTIEDQKRDKLHGQKKMKWSWSGMCWLWKWPDVGVKSALSALSDSFRPTAYKKKIMG